MKKSSVVAVLFCSVTLFCSVLLGPNASASPINLDFSDGLNGWGADIVYFDGAIDVNEFDVDTSLFPDLLSVSGNEVTLMTFDDFPLEYWGIYLFQSFVVPNTAALLSLDFSFTADFAYVTLVDDNGLLLHDFINDNKSVNLSGLEGVTVSLEFGVEDADFILGDFLSVSNIALSQYSVPEPSTILLLIVLVMYFAARAFIDKNHSKKH